MPVRVDINMETRSPQNAINWQAAHCLRNDAPITGRVVQAMLPLLESDTLCGSRMANWPGLTAEDAMPLRLAGGLHHLHLTGADERLAPVYGGEITDQTEIDAVVVTVVRTHDQRLLGWLDGPPQTNEAGRSSSIMGALLWLSKRVGPKFELLEIGASAGANTMIERYAFDLGGVTVGPRGANVCLRPEWRGMPPPDAPVEIVSIRGCDRAPIDLGNPDQALRLKAYCWPENTQRLARLDAVIDEARRRPPLLDKADAADWIAERLAEPQAAGVTRVMFHSIVWQYLPIEGRARIEAAMARAAVLAEAESPLAWVMLETNRQTFRHELRLRYWPGSGEDWVLLGEAHAHGAWVEWYGC